MRLTARIIAVVAAICGIASIATACGNDVATEPSTDSDPVVVQINFSDDSVDPHGTQVDVPLGHSVELDVTADAAGEIHVHTDPAQSAAYGVGTTRISLGAFDIPGQFVVESHTLGKTIVTLEVR
ncbi:putative lipoprotein [Nocardioidaceae bacterium Broad-1]|nr:putative lipoprotein [Nocardioidaceae bacterium Broad-1]